MKFDLDPRDFGAEMSAARPTMPETIL